MWNLCLAEKYKRIVEKVNIYNDDPKLLELHVIMDITMQKRNLIELSWQKTILIIY